MRSLAFLAVLLASRTAAAEPRPQVQADLGLSVVCVGYERPLGAHTAAMIGAGIFGTYFLPWFDRGDDVAGAVAEVRGTWCRGDDGRGLYVTPYLRGGYAKGAAITGGGFVGYGFAVGRRLDLRVGAGAQYMYIADHASTPFVALDLTLGYRL